MTTKKVYKLFNYFRKKIQLNRVIFFDKYKVDCDQLAYDLIESNIVFPQIAKKPILYKILQPNSITNNG